MSLAKTARFTLRLPDLLLSLGLLMFFILVPSVLYSLHQDSASKLMDTKDRLSQHRELMSDIRREAVSLNSGMHTDSASVLLADIERYNRSAETLNQVINRHPDVMAGAKQHWLKYQQQHQSFLLQLRQVASLSAQLQERLNQSQILFQRHKKILAQSDLPEAEQLRYQVYLAELMNLNLRFAARPDSEAALALATALDRLQIRLQTEPDGPALTLLEQSLRFHRQLKQVVSETHSVLNALSHLPVYYRFETFYKAFEKTLLSNYQNNRLQVELLVYGLIFMFMLTLVFSLYLKTWKRRLETTNAELAGFKNALDEHAIVSMTDKRGVINYVNKKFVEISGYQPEELLGKTHRLVNSGLHPKAFFAQLWQCIRENRIWHGDVCNTTKEGEHYWVRATVLPIFNRAGQLESIISVRTDITLQKKVEQALVKEKEKADKANEAKSRFLANMSHEIRTPMNAVIGLSHLALQGSQEQKTQDYLSKIQNAAHNLLGIINDILDFSKIEAGKLDIETIPYRLDNVLNNLAAVAEVKAAEKQLPLTVCVDPEVPNFLLGDPLRLGQVLLNLTNNAIKFTHQGEVQIRVDLIQRYEDQAELRFSVKDQGIGMSEQVQARLFEAFNQADVSTTREYGGTGLGLAICKQLVELMGGQIGVFSSVGQGSEFYFTLTNPVEEKRVHSVSDVQTLRVLCIDDEEVALASVSRQLTAAGMNVITESSAPKALNRVVNTELMGEDAFDVLVVDWDMPLLNGLEVAQSVRNNPQLEPQPVIILLTAHCDEALQQEIHGQMIDNVLLKPVTSSHLVDTIQESLHQRRQYDERHDGTALNRLPGFNAKEQRLKACAGARVLVAEDNLINQEVILGLLEQYQLEITLVDDGVKAVNAVQEQSFDLILMDIQMPRLDGLQASRQILQLQPHKAVPVIAMTAHALQEDIAECYQVGMSDHIAKPIDPAQLERVLARWIEPRALLAEDRPEPRQPDSLPAVAVVDRQDTDILQQLTALLPEDEFDSAQALRSTSQDRRLLLRLLQHFSQDYQASTQPARSWIKANNWPELQHWLHTLKGSAGTLGFLRLAGQAGALERQVLNHQMPDSDALQRVTQALEQVTGLINQVFAQNESDEKTAHRESRTEDNAGADTEPGSLAAPEAEIGDVKTALEPVLEQIIQLLQEGDADVLDYTRELMQLAPKGTLWHDTALEIEALAEDFDFEPAIPLAEKLVGQLKN